MRSTRRAGCYGDTTKRAASAGNRLRASTATRLRRVDFSLSTDQKEIKALAQDFARAEIEPNAAEWDREHRFPRELFGRLAELGLMGVCVPEEYGGGGAGFLSHILVVGELSPSGAGGRVTGAGHTSAATLPPPAYRGDEHKTRFL